MQFTKFVLFNLMLSKLLAISVNKSVLNNSGELNDKLVLVTKNVDLEDSQSQKSIETNKEVITKKKNFIKMNKNSVHLNKELNKTKIGQSEKENAPDLPKNVSKPKTEFSSFTNRFEKTKNMKNTTQQNNMSKNAPLVYNNSRKINTPLKTSRNSVTSLNNSGFSPPKRTSTPLARSTPPRANPTTPKRDFSAQRVNKFETNNTPKRPGTPKKVYTTQRNLTQFHDRNEKRLCEKNKDKNKTEDVNKDEKVSKTVDPRNLKIQKQFIEPEEVIVSKEAVDTEKKNKRNELNILGEINKIEDDRKSNNKEVIETISKPEKSLPTEDTNKLEEFNISELDSTNENLTENGFNNVSQSQTPVNESKGNLIITTETSQLPPTNLKIPNGDRPNKITSFNNLKKKDEKIWSGKTVFFTILLTGNVIGGFVLSYFFFKK